MHFYDNFGPLPDVKGYNLHCCGDLGVVEMLLDYPGGDIYNSCMVIHLRDGEIAHVRAYFGQPFEGAGSRSEWVEMMGENAEETYESRTPPRA